MNSHSQTDCLPMLTDILTEYRQILKGIPLWDASGLMHWLEEVSFWLARVRDEEDYRRWAMLFAMALQDKAGKPLSLCLGLLEGHVVRCMEEGGITR